MEDHFAVRVLIADTFEPSGREALAALGCEVLYEPKLADEALAQAAHELRPDILVVRSTKVNAAVLEAPWLKLVVRAGAGYNTIDVAAASKRGIYVSNCPGKNSVAVAELAFGLMLALDRRLADNVIALRAGQWNKKQFSQARGLFGRTLGLIGLGQIGMEMLPRAKAFGMPVIAWSRSLTAERAKQLNIGNKNTPSEVAGEADVVSVHLALTKETRGLLDADFFKAMRPGAYFINTARGELVDQTALVWAMRERKIRVGLDVYASEPTESAGAFSDPIAQETTLYGTHHIGASTEQAQEAIAAETVRIIRSFQETGRAPNVVNIARHTPATYLLSVRHRDRPGVLARVLDAISAARINVQEMENIVFEGAEAAVANIQLETAPGEDILNGLRRAEADVFELRLTSLGK
ncbi:MAG TPA: phosphoglycerate dehydrogenase [Pirellulales bacterium]|nr:phosphoglycerate dehydrogenase [Pirellulales bacterium]